MAPAGCQCLFEIRSSTVYDEAQGIASLLKFYLPLGKGCFERLVFLNPSPLQDQKKRHLKSLLWTKKNCHIFHFNFLNVSGGKDIIFGNYGPGWKLHRKLLTTALRQYLSDIPLIESRVNTQAEKLVLSMEKQQGQPFDPADCLMRAVADVIVASPLEKVTTQPMQIWTSFWN